VFQQGAFAHDRAWGPTAVQQREPGRLHRSETARSAAPRSDRRSRVAATSYRCTCRL
jgi:hypothetical protein